MAEVLSRDAEHVQAQRGPVELSLKTLELPGLFITAVTQLLDQSWVQLRCPLGQTSSVSLGSTPKNFTQTNKQ